MKNLKRLLSLFLIILLWVESTGITLAQIPASGSAGSREVPIEVLGNLPSPEELNPLDKSLVDNGQDISSAELRLKAHVKALGKRSYRADERVKVVIKSAAEEGIYKLKLSGPGGKEIKAEVKQVAEKEDRVLEIIPPQQFKPGKYTLEIRDERGKVASTQNFFWGVLALNTNKPVYAPGETAGISIAVLDEKGVMVCDAEVTLTIKSPKSEKVLSTKTGEIKVNNQCNEKTFSLTPDYETEYKIAHTGTHEMVLVARTANGSYSIQDAFSVKESPDFDIERVSTTRIYPPLDYPMRISITAKNDFSGTITDVVPESFELRDTEGAIGFESVRTVTKAQLTGNQVLGAMSLSLPVKESAKTTAVFGGALVDPLLRAKYTQYGLQGHDGVDFDVPVGTEVYAIDDGKVVLAEENSDYGTTLVIEHSWGKSYYGHLSKITVDKGEKVKKGEEVALSGNTGLTTGPHLHLSIKPTDFDSKNGYYGKVDPAPYLGLPDESSVLGASAVADIKVKVVTWKVDVKKGETYTIGYSFKTPPQSPQFYTLGPLRFFDTTQKLVHEEGRRWQLAVDAPTGNGMLIYDEDAANAQAPHSRTWSPSDLSAESDMNRDGTLFEDVNHTIVKASPTRNEYLRASLDASGTLNVELFDGSSWTFGDGAPHGGNFTTSIGTTDDVNRNFDIAYETTSGDAMVIYEDTTTDNKDLKYRTWNGTTWSSEQTLDYTAVAEGGANDQAEWVELKARGTSGANEIMLGWKDATGDGIYAAVWDGDSWEDIALINGAGINHLRRSFDVAWEGTSDQGMIVYGTGTTTDHSVYDISAGTWTDGASSANPGEAVDWINLAAEGDTDYIAMIITSGASTSTSDTSVDIWNGDNWTAVTTPTEDTDINTYGFAQSADVAWEATGDRALFVWRDGTTSETALRYMVYDRGSNAFQAIDNNVNCLLTEGGAGTTETVTSLSAVMDSGGPCSGLGAWAGIVSGIKLAPDPASSAIMLVAANQATTAILPEAQLWNGDANGTWLTQTANMGAFETDASPGTFPTATAPYRAYDYAWKEATPDNTGLLVYDEDGANINQPPHYRTWSGTDFSAEANQQDWLSNTSSEALFSILRAAPTRDEYIAGRLTSDGHLNVQVWDGDSWEYGANAPDAFTKGITSVNAVNRAFDIAYEHTSGDAIVVYEDSASNDTTIKYRIWDGSSWSSEGTIDYDAVDEAADVAAWIELSARTTGDEIMLGWQDKTGLGYYGAVWDGDSWEDVALINGAGTAINQQSFDVAWEGTSDQGMFLYGTGTTTDYSTYDISDSAWTDGSGSVNTGAAVVWLRIDEDPSSDYIAAIIIDTVSTTSSDIQVDIWNGADWTTVTTPTADADIDTYGFAQGTDVAWEQNNANGRALFVWREDTTNTTLNYMVYDRTANQFQAIDDNSVCTLTEGGAGTTEVVTAIDNAEDSGGPCAGLGTWAGTVSGIRLYPDPSSNIIAVLAQNETVLDVRPQMQLWNGDGTWLTQTTNMGAFETDASLGTLPTATNSTLPYAFAFNKSDGVTAPDAPLLHPDDGGVTQTAFNNIRQNSITPTFRASATHTGDFDRFQLELNPAADFSGTAYTQTFSNTYTSGTQYNLAADSLSPSLPTTNGVTYYARIRASADSGSSWSAWSTGTWTYTYKNNGNPDWFQTTDEQFATGTFTGVGATGSDSVGLTGSGSVTPTVDYSDIAFSASDTNPTWTPSGGTLPAGKLVVAMLVWGNHPSPSGTMTLPSGWNTWPGYNVADVWGSSSTIGACLCYRYTGSSEPSSYTWTKSGTINYWEMSVVVIDGAHPTTPFTVTPSSNLGSDSSVEHLSVTTTTDNNLILLFGANEVGSLTITPPEGYTEIEDDGVMWVSHGNKGAAGAVGAQTTTLNTGASWISLMVAVNPAVAPVFRSASTFDGTGPSAVLNKPSGTAENDVMVAAIYKENNEALSSVPTGWALIDRETPSSQHDAFLYWKRAGASEPSSYSWDWSSNTVARGMIMSYSGVIASGDPINVSSANSGASSQTMTHTGVTTSVDNTMLIAIATHWNAASGQFTQPTGFDERVDLAALYVSEDEALAAGSTGDKTTTTSAGAGSWTAHLIALTPRMAPSGTVMSPEIDYDWVPGASSWGTVDWGEDETNGSLLLSLYYTSSTACDTIVPNAALSGNESGFASGPIDVSGLNTTTYNRICLEATLTDSGGSPLLEDWTVSWDSGSETPALSQLIRHGRWFNSSGVIRPFTF